MGDKTVDLLNLMRGNGGAQLPGLRVAVVNTTDPAPVTLLIEGTTLPLDLDVFEIPVNMYPLRRGDRFLVFPLVGRDLGQRWGVLNKINGGLVLATMTGTSSCQVEGIGRQYTAADLIIPPFFAVKAAYNRTSDFDGSQKGVWSPYPVADKNDVLRPLKAGDRVALSPTLEGSKIKYVIIEIVEGV